MGNNTQTVDAFLLSISSAYSLATIENALSLLILIINSVWLCLKIIFKIVNTIKQKKHLTDVEDDVALLVETIEDVKEAITHKDINE